MTDIFDRISQDYIKDLHCIYSDDNDDKLILRIRLVNDNPAIQTDS